MEKTIQHPTLGEVVYRESGFSGKTELWVNGRQLVKQGKRDFLYVDAEGAQKTVAISGSALLGVSLTYDGQTVAIIPAPKKYEGLCSLFIFLFVLVWGNVPALCMIFPIIGGAIGGMVSGLMSMLNLMLMQKVQSPALKIVVWLAMFAGTVLLCYFLAILFVLLFSTAM